MIKFTATYRNGDTMIIERNITTPCSTRIIDPAARFTLARFAAAFIELKYNIPRFIYGSDVDVSEIEVL